MTKKNTKNSVLWAVIILVSVLAVGTIVGFAYSGYGAPKYLAEGGATINVNEAAETSDSQNNLGAVSGPDMPFSYLSWGGVEEYRLRQKMVTSTTTPCAIQSPAATSTLHFAYVDMDTSTSSNSIVTIAKAASAFATTTGITTRAVTANTQAFIAASSSIVFEPSQWLVVGMQGNAGNYSPAGDCLASWIRTDYEHP